MFTDTGSNISPTTDLEPTIDTILPVVNLHGQQNVLGKADRFRLANNGSELASFICTALINMIN